MSTVLEKKVAALAATVAAMEPKSAASDIADIKDQMQAIDRRMNAIDISINGILERLDGIEIIEEGRQANEANALKAAEDQASEEAAAADRELRDRLKAEAEASGVAFDVLMAAHIAGSGDDGETEETEETGEGGDGGSDGGSDDAGANTMQTGA